MGNLDPPGQKTAAVLLVFAAVAICSLAARALGGGKDPQAIVLDEIDDMLDRPLFHISRRPAPPQDVDQARRTGPIPASQVLKLVGTFHANNTAVALFRHRESGMLRKRQGQAIEGWQVDRIDRGRVLLTRGSESEWLALTKPPSQPLATAQILAFKETSSAADTAPTPRTID